MPQAAPVHPLVIVLFINPIASGFQKFTDEERAHVNPDDPFGAGHILLQLKKVELRGLRAWERRRMSALQSARANGDWCLSYFINPVGASEVDPGCIDFKPGDQPIHNTLLRGGPLP